MAWRFASIVAVTLGWAAVALADEPNPAHAENRLKRSEARGQRPSKEFPAFTASREAAAMTFVAQNHPELRKLLKALAETDAAAYQSAIRDLFAESERLAELQAKDSELYAAALEEWKLGSRIDLLAARMQKEQSLDPEKQKRMRNLVKKQLEAELERRRIEVRRLEQILERRRKEIEERSNSLDSLVEARMSKLSPAKAAETPRSETPNDPRAASATPNKAPK